MPEVKCYYCKEKFDKKMAVRIDDKNFHPDCARTYQEKKECCDYICNIFGLKVPGPKIYSQLSLFTSQYNYSFCNIKKVLKYWYEVKKGSRSKAKEGIGIVPLIYDEAMAYYKKEQEKIVNTKIAYEKAVEEQNNKEKVSVTVVSGQPRKNRYYELY